MKKFVLLAIIALSSFSVFPQQALEFSDYRVKIEKGKAKQINFSSHKLARKYRTNLRETLKSGVNFAGRYAVSIWGCGSICVRAAIIDTKTGNTLFPKQLDTITPGQGSDYAMEGIEFKKNSRLLIVHGGYGSAEKFGAWYYLWNGRTLKLIKFVES